MRYNKGKMRLFEHPTVDAQRVPREAFKHKAGFVDVVIGVYNVCGNRYYSADTLKRVQALATGTLPLERIEQVPVTHAQD